MKFLIFICFSIFFTPTLGQNARFSNCIVTKSIFQNKKLVEEYTLSRIWYDEKNRPILEKAFDHRGVIDATTYSYYNNGQLVYRATYNSLGAEIEYFTYYSDRELKRKNLYFNSKLLESRIFLYSKEAKAIDVYQPRGGVIALVFKERNRFDSLGRLIEEYILDELNDTTYYSRTQYYNNRVEFKSFGSLGAEQVSYVVELNSKGKPIRKVFYNLEVPATETVYSYSEFGKISSIVTYNKVKNVRRKELFLYHNNGSLKSHEILDFTEDSHQRSIYNERGFLISQMSGDIDNRNYVLLKYAYF